MIECSFYVSTNIVTFAKKDCKSSVNNQTASHLVEVLLIFDMEQVNLGYSKKNIPLPNNKNVQLLAIDRMKTFQRNATLRAMVYLNPDFKSNGKETYGTKSPFEPQRLPQMKEFEDECIDLVEKSKDGFQKQIIKDINKIKSDEKVICASRQNNKPLQSKC